VWGPAESGGSARQIGSWFAGACATFARVRRPHVFLQLPRGDVGDLFDSDRPGPAEYVAETHRQREVFGPPPTPEQAVAGFLSELGYTVNAETRGA